MKIFNDPKAPIAEPTVDVHAVSLGTIALAYRGLICHLNPDSANPAHHVIEGCPLSDALRIREAGFGDFDDPDAPEGTPSIKSVAERTKKKDAADKPASTIKQPPASAPVQQAVIKQPPSPGFVPGSPYSAQQKGQTAWWVINGPDAPEKNFRKDEAAAEVARLNAEHEAKTGAGDDAGEESGDKPPAA